MERIIEEIRRSSPCTILAYLSGALGDATFNARHRTWRFGQRDARWLGCLAVALDRLGHRSWTYREGRARDFWVLETRAPLDKGSVPVLDPQALAYVRGYFDAEGGMPHDASARAYLQFVQKDRASLDAVREMLERAAIRCGALHNPSARVDPGYWRFYVLAESHGRFMQLVGSWHPAKRLRMEERVHADATPPRAR